MKSLLRTIILATLTLAAFSCTKEEPALLLAPNPTLSALESNTAVLTWSPVANTQEYAYRIDNDENLTVTKDTHVILTGLSLGSHTFYVKALGDNSSFTDSEFGTTGFRIEKITANVSFDGDYWNALIDNPQYGGPLLYGELIDPTYGMYSGTDYNWTDETTQLSSRLENKDWFGMMTYMGGGEAISNYVESDISKADYKLQLAVPVNLDNEKNNFCVHYGYLTSPNAKLNGIYFKDNKARVIESMDVCNISYYLNSMNPVCEKDPKTWTAIEAVGYDAEGNITGKASFYLTQQGKNLTGWKNWNLSSLGAVVRVGFDIKSSYENAYGLMAPAYFAYDNVNVVLESL